MTALRRLRARLAWYKWVFFCPSSHLARFAVERPIADLVRQRWRDREPVAGRPAWAEKYWRWDIEMKGRGDA